VFFFSFVLMCAVHIGSSKTRVCFARSDTPTFLGAPVHGDGTQESDSEQPE
jgi:hypothetical protein